MKVSAYSSIYHAAWQLYGISESFVYDFFSFHAKLTKLSFFDGCFLSLMTSELQLQSLFYITFFRGIICCPLHVTQVLLNAGLLLTSEINIIWHIVEYVFFFQIHPKLKSPIPIEDRNLNAMQLFNQKQFSYYFSCYCWLFLNTFMYHLITKSDISKYL